MELLVFLFVVIGVLLLTLVLIRKISNKKIRKDKEISNKWDKIKVQFITYKSFENIKYLGGLNGMPNPTKSTKLNILVVKKGIYFYENKNYNQIGLIEWNKLVSISSSTEMNASHQAMATGMSARSRSAGGAFTAGVVSGLLQKYPLTFSFKQNMSDGFIQKAYFNDINNNSIRNAIIWVNTVFVLLFLNYSTKFH